VGGSRSALASPVSQALSLTTVRMAGLAPERIPHAVVALARGVATNMLHKSSVLTALVCGSVALAGIGLVARQMSDANAGEPGAREGREVSDPASAMSINHIKQIMLAFHNYASANGHFPPKAIVGADGEPKLSWRVALLPFLEQEALFREFHQDESWDSPHNKALIARMPDSFTTPSSPAGDGSTRIRLFEGPGTLFDGSRGMTFSDITDGTSNTVAIVTAREAVPWTRPGELPYAKGKPLPELDDSSNKGVLMGMADGSARYLPRGAGDDGLWRNVITPAGGEVVTWPSSPHMVREPVLRAANVELLPTPTASLPAQVTINTSAASPMSPELDARLRAIEATLDRLVRKLDALDKRPAPQ
jgi:Protein of unknown function (DUF1559)